MCYFVSFQGECKDSISRFKREIKIKVCTGIYFQSLNKSNYLTIQVLDDISSQKRHWGDQVCTFDGFYRRKGICFRKNISQGRLILLYFST